MTRRLLYPLLALLVAAGLLLSYVLYQVSRPYRGWQQPVLVDIPPGTSTRAIAAQLQGAGALRRQWPFLLLHYLLPGASLKAGEYYFDCPMSPREILHKLRRGDVYYYTVTIPEGFNVFEVAEALASTGLVSHDQTQQALARTDLIADLDPGASSLEGYLFPDTYLFVRRTTAGEMVAAMVARFRRVYRELEERHKPRRPVHEIVTLASLVEEETGIGEERPLVASVFYNRWQAGMPLQCDPTVTYAALLGGRYRGAIYRGDLAYHSPYNTYLRRGLPPGPIANPGRASLEAAMAPAATNYRYFVSDGRNGHRFSATLAEHSRAVAQYRRSANSVRR